MRISLGISRLEIGDKKEPELTSNEVEVLDPVSHELDSPTIVLQQDLVVV